MTPGPGIEPGTHWWEASALTTAPSLLPMSANVLKFRRTVRLNLFLLVFSVDTGRTYLCFFFKAKLKKIKEKYGEQDEEERQMKMEILAVGSSFERYV